MSNSLFFADIDPNQTWNAVTAKVLRRILLSRLLVWDTVVVSDSQMLQDPRFRIMMSPPTGEKKRRFNQAGDNQFDDLEDWQHGFDHLLKDGLVEVACRKGKDGPSSLLRTWSDMNKSENRVPFLPQSESYANFIEKIGYSARVFELSNVARRFRHNLQEGISNHVIKFEKHNDAYQEYINLISADYVQLRDILALLDAQMNDGAITCDEHNLIYQFSFQCYSINVPAETGCYVSAKLDHIPLFLPSGTYDGIDGSKYINQSKLRPTWAIDPVALDLLPIEAFVEMRKNLKNEIASGLILKAKEGNLQSGRDAAEFYSIWESYTSKLEEEMKRSLRVTRDKLNEITRSNFILTQKQLEDHLTEIVATRIVSAIPPVGTIYGAYKDVKEIIDSTTIFNQKKTQAYYLDHHDNIKNYLDTLYDNRSSIITKY